MGIPPTGTTFSMTGQTVLHFRAGRVVERWSTADLLSLLVQLGAVRLPAEARRVDADAAERMPWPTLRCRAKILRWVSAPGCSGRS